MNLWRRWTLSAVFVVCLILYGTAASFADMPEDDDAEIGIGYGESDEEIFGELEEPGQPEIVYDEAELQEWIKRHKITGGTVSLGTSITITQSMGVYGIYGHIIIDTGKYGLVFDGAVLPSSDIFIIGEGVDMPVVDVLRAASDSIWEDSWNNTLLQLNVTAAGRDGAGGIALRILAEDTKAVSTDLSNQGLIRSYGEGAVGLWLDVPMEAWCYRVEVFGENSTALYAPNGANLYYCKLTAEGNGACTAAGSNLVLDSCAAFPIPSGVQIINRRALEESFTQLYLPLKQNAYYSSSIKMLNTPNIFLSGGEGFPGITQPFSVFWDMDAYSNIDISILGKTILSGTVAPLFYGLGVFDDTVIELTIEVRDPALPCISTIRVMELDGQRLLSLGFWESYDPQDETVILWRSDDEGETWQEATLSQDIEWINGSVKFTYGELEHPVWFQLEVTGVGESNIAVLNEKDGVSIGGNGGDRTGTDRDGVKPPGGTVETDNKPNGDGSGTPENGGEPGSDNGDRPENSTKDIMEIITAPALKKKNLKYINNEKSTSHTGNEQADRDLGQPLPIDTFLSETSPEDISERETALETGSSAQRIPSTAGPEADKMPMAHGEQEIFTAPADETPLPDMDRLQSFDPAQSAPQPRFEANTIAIVFMYIAALCSGALLILHLNKYRRRRYEKL